ncbi:MAG TPA: TRAP transporter substrate-binding protein [Alphaproteobacteria bacterium]|nr:TRAP transporter substrate-binding protein [Alphaproteobacteria bacterium]
MNARLGWLAIAAAALFATAGAQAQQFTMKISSPTVNDVTGEWAKAFKAGVEARSNGKIKVEYYPASQLGQIPATVDGVAMGTIEMSIPAVGFLIGLEPRFQVFDAPGLFDSVVHGEKVLTDPDIRKRYSEFGADKGIEPLTVFINGPQMVVSHTAIHGSADFRSLKIRVPGAAPLYVEPFRKLGASPLSIPLGEVLPALQNHTIDGAVAAIAVLVAFKYYDIAKPMTYLPGTYLLAAGIVNRGWMKSLGPDLEKIVREESAKAESLYSTWGVDDAKRAAETWQQKGGEVITMAPDQAKQYLADVTSVMPPILSANPKVKADYDALLAAAQKYR